MESNELFIELNETLIARDKNLIGRDNRLIEQDNFLTARRQNLTDKDKDLIARRTNLTELNNDLIRVHFLLKHEEKPKIWPVGRTAPLAPGLGGGARLLTSRLARTLAPPTADSKLPALPQRVDSRRSFTRMPLAGL